MAKNKIPTDKEMLDWLQDQLEQRSYTGMVAYRMSENGRGIRLHETSAELSFTDIRICIADAMSRETK